MPAYARHVIVTDNEVGVYHCIARCVRRAFLCGADPVTGQDYEHRKDMHNSLARIDHLHLKRQRPQ